MIAAAEKPNLMLVEKSSLSSLSPKLSQLKVGPARNPAENFCASATEQKATAGSKISSHRITLECPLLMLPYCLDLWQIMNILA
jgi:hypothetical protein